MKNKNFWLYSGLFVLAIIIVLLRTNVVSVEGLFQRDEVISFYQEIGVLRAENKNLADEVKDLERTLDQLSDQNKALAAIQDEIQKYRKLSGEKTVFGPGLTISVDAELSTPWLVDMVNEFFRYGAQAVAINGIRLTNQSVGFDTLPRGQVLLNGVILKRPYKFDVIGDGQTLVEVLAGPGGMFNKLRAGFPALVLDAAKKDIVQL